MSGRDQFLDLRLDLRNIDRFIMRSAIEKAVKDNAKYLAGRLLDVGCGRMPYRQWILSNSDVSQYIGMDLETADYGSDIDADIFWDGQTIPCDSATFDSIIATEFLEHCPDPSGVLREVTRVLRRGGSFFFTVPFLWPLHEVPYDQYRYTPFALDRLLLEAGFRERKIDATGGWNACLGQFIALWAIRGIGGRKGRWIARLLKPAIPYLLRHDDRPRDFKESQMILGLCGLCRV